MALDADPYRTLGLPRGASLDEVKRAYRQLAKVNHPDAAGEAALPRFLAIQAAYEQLVGGPAGKARARGGAKAPPKAWQGGPHREEATRRAAGTRRGPRAGGGATPGGTRSAPRSGQPADEPTGEPTRDAGRRNNKATLGSTSYDGATDQPFEPDWGGASWYGTTSGTYWTLNPREYADPRKHGPEYQARARRAARDRESKASAAGNPDTSPDAAAHPVHTTSTWWDSTAGGTAPPPNLDTDRPSAAQRPRTNGPATRDAQPPPPDLGQAATDLARALTDERSGGLAARVVRAIVGWLPIALGLGWVVGELTGCGRFAATCDGSAAPFVLAMQVGALAALLAVPALASIATTAAVTLLAVALVGALILSAAGGAAESDARRAALGAVLLLAWLAGLAFAVVRRVRGVRSSARPLS